VKIAVVMVRSSRFAALSFSDFARHRKERGIYGFEESASRFANRRRPVLLPDLARILTVSPVRIERGSNDTRGATKTAEALPVSPMVSVVTGASPLRVSLTWPRGCRKGA
jgi:hypothetical protein